MTGCPDMDRRAFDVLVVGAGPAGMAAAVGACACGAQKVAVLERQGFAGGVLPQCVHDGFGLHLYGESLTGPEYSQKWLNECVACGIDVFFESTVLSIEATHEVLDASDACGSFAVNYDGEGVLKFAVKAIGAQLGGAVTLLARSVVVATGCRERTRGQLGIAGTRPAGVMTAGCAQYMMNVANQLPGDKAVILGTGDIGLIMARRLTLEGAQVRLVLGQEATGLLRNHIRCIDDFGIPVRYGWGIASIHGRGQLKGVMVAPYGADGAFNMEKKQYIRCNLLLLACGLIPEREVLGTFGAEEPGLFVCGNAQRPHDLVDQVTQDGLAAGQKAAEYALCENGGQALPKKLQRMLKMQVVETKGAHVSSVPDTQDGIRLDVARVVCSACPASCVISVSDSGEVNGYRCERGMDYARTEVRSPMRTFTGTVRLRNPSGEVRLLPVRTDREVARSYLMVIARFCRRIQASVPVSAGQVIARNVAGSGADLVACASIAAHGVHEPCMAEVSA